MEAKNIKVLLSKILTGRGEHVEVIDNDSLIDNVLSEFFSENEKKVITLKSLGLTYFQIGEEIGLSKSRACQIMQYATRKIKHPRISVKLMKEFEKGSK